MSLFGPLFKSDGDLADVSNVKAYLKKELGVSLQTLQEDSIVEAIAQPENFMKKRKAALNDASDLSATAFTEAVKEFSQLGLPDETVKALALKRAQRSYDDKLEVLNIQMPGYSRAIGKVEGDRANLESRGSKEERRAIKAKAVSKYKASKKAQKQGQQLIPQ